MTIDRLLALVSSLCIALVLAVGGWLMMFDQRALLVEARQRQIDQAGVVFTMAMDQAATLSATHSEAMAADPDVRALLAAGDRNGLQAHAKPVFDRLSRLAGVDVVHFHDAQMRSFLRVWEPDNFGQDLSTFRPMVVASNHDRRTQKGLELGIRGLSLRAVSAVVATDGVTLLGTVELGVNLQALADLAKAASGSDFALVLDPRYLRNSGAQASAGGGLVLDAATDRGLFERIMASGEAQLSRDIVVFTHGMNNKRLTVQSKPLIDYSGNAIGVVLTASDVGTLESHYYRTIVTLACLFLAGFFVVMAVILVAVRTAVVRPVRDLADKLEAAPQDLAGMTPGSALADYRRLLKALTAAVQASSGGQAGNEASDKPSEKAGEKAGDTSGAKE